MMIRALALSATLAAAACASTLPTAQQLIVGAWDCHLPTMNEGDSYIVTFTPDKVVRLYFDSSPNSGAEPISVNADLSGHYILAEGALGAQFDVAKLHSVTVNGKAIPPSQLREFEPRLIASMNQSLAAPIDVLDSQQLILSSTEGGSPFPCKRRGQKVMSALRLETKP